MLGPAWWRNSVKKICILLVAGSLVVAGTTACSLGSPTATRGSAGATAGAINPPDSTRPPGPAATFAGPLSGGRGIALPSAGTNVDLGAAGYIEAEYTASGTATSYRTTGGELPSDGRFALEPSASADYSTRIVVRRPKGAQAFSGTVAVEWLNVSGGNDAAPDYTYLAPELLRKGYVWVGVSAQRIGVEGGQVAVRIPEMSVAAGAGQGLRRSDPDRYGSLHHPGDAFSYDIFTQVARALRTPGALDPLGGLATKRILAVGESQSAFMLTTYYDGVQPITSAFDGFLIHSRGGAAAPLSTESGAIDVPTAASGAPTRLRTDQAAPTIVIETETDMFDLLRYFPARQPDHDHLRVWEVAGAAHADKYVIGSIEPALGCSQPINRGQQYAVLRAALRHLNDWVATGAAPPSARPFEIATGEGAPAFVTDEVGNVKAGVRTPAVDAPVDRLSGLPSGSSAVVCLLSGTTTPLSAGQLAGLYPSGAAYLTAYARAADAAIDAGFVVREDRDELMGQADPARLPG
jgi:hypothetical protein